MVELLNIAMIALKATVHPGLPILSAWIGQDGHYAFVEFRSIEECNNGFCLGQISIYGHPLRVGRTKMPNALGQSM